MLVRHQYDNATTPIACLHTHHPPSTHHPAPPSNHPAPSPQHPSRPTPKALQENMFWISKSILLFVCSSMCGIRLLREGGCPPAFGAAAWLQGTAARRRSLLLWVRRGSAIRLEKESKVVSPKSICSGRVWLFSRLHTCYLHHLQFDVRAFKLVQKSSKHANQFRERMLTRFTTTCASGGGR